MNLRSPWAGKHVLLPAEGRTGVCGDAYVRTYEEDDGPDTSLRVAVDTGGQVEEFDALRVLVVPDTAAELLALLRANPDVTFAAVAALRVAGPWEDAGTLGACRRDPQKVAVAGITRAIVGWRQWVSYARSIEPPVYASMDEAKAVEDARLRAAGWVLAGAREGA